MQVLVSFPENKTALKVMPLHAQSFEIKITADSQVNLRICGN
jgi:hypothetical protein